MQTRSSANVSSQYADPVNAIKKVGAVKSVGGSRRSALGDISNQGRGPTDGAVKAKAPCPPAKSSSEVRRSHSAGRVRRLC